MAAQPNLVDQMAAFNNGSTQQQVDQNETSTYYDNSHSFMNQTCPAIITTHKDYKSFVPYQPPGNATQQAQVPPQQAPIFVPQSLYYEQSITPAPNQYTKNMKQQQQGEEREEGGDEDDEEGSREEEEPQAQEQPSILKKTFKKHLCDGYKNGFCAYGDSCRFAHGEQEIRSTTSGKLRNSRTVSTSTNPDPSRFNSPRRMIRKNRQYPNVICRNYQRGECKYGQICRFYHPPGLEHQHQQNPQQQFQQDQGQVPQCPAKPVDMNQTMPATFVTATQYVPYNPNYPPPPFAPQHFQPMQVQHAAAPPQMPVFYPGYQGPVVYPMYPQFFQRN